MQTDADTCLVMKKINDLKWHEFDVKEVFPDIMRGRRLKTDDHIIGEMPYVSSSAMDNGVDNFVSNDKGVRIFSNCLTIANSGSVGATFYHPYQFVASDHVTSLANINFNKYIYLFIATVASRLSEKYSFNREIKDPRLQREKIMLPIKDDGTPDYGFMEEYMRKVELCVLKRYKKYAQSSDETIKNNKKVVWGEVRLLDLFTAKKGNQKNMNSLMKGNNPLISAKKIDNGYKGFYDVDKKEIFDGHCITLNNDGDGGAGLAYYQPSSFALDTHVTALYPKQKISKEALLYISCSVSKQSILFGHGHSINSERLKHFTIMLPITATGSPNFAYMEDYMRNKERLLLNRYIDKRLKSIQGK